MLLQLAQRGVAREEAYLWVQRNAMRAHDEGLEFKELLLNDPDVVQALTRTDIEQTFDLSVQLRHVDTIFGRVFGGVAARAGA